MLGDDLLQRLWKNDGIVDQFFGSILGGNALSIYDTSVGSKDKTILNFLQMTYMLSWKKILNASNKQFKPINDVAAVVGEATEEGTMFRRILMNAEEFYELANRLNL